MASDNCDMVVRQLDDNDVSYEQRDPPKVLHGRYLKGQCVARGSVAVVKEAYDLWNDCVVALKVFKVSRSPLRPHPFSFSLAMSRV